MEHYSGEDFDEKEICYPQSAGVEDAAALLLSDQLMDDDEDSEIYEMDEEDFEEEDDEIVIPATSEPKFSDEMEAFYLDDEGEEEYSAVDLVQENPFEPVYPATSAGLLFDENSSDTNEQNSGKGIVLEAVSLDNILPAGSRRRRQL